MSIGNLPESLSQAMLVGIMLVGRLGVESDAPLVRFMRSLLLLKHKQLNKETATCINTSY